MDPSASDIRIDKEGVWYYRGVEMSRVDIIAHFYRHLFRDELGRYFIAVGPQRYQVDVEDTAYVVSAVHHIDGGNDTEEGIHLLLSDGSVESLDPCTLRIGSNNIPYCKVRNRRFDARFSRSSYYQFAEHVNYDPQRNAYFIRLNGQHHYIPAD